VSNIHFTPGEILTLLTRAEAGATSREIAERLRWFHHFAEHGSVSATCREFGIARTTFYRWMRRFDPADLRTLMDQPTVQVSADRPVTSQILASTSQRIEQCVQQNSMTTAKQEEGGETQQKYSCLSGIFHRGAILWFAVVSMLLNGIFITLLFLKTDAASTPQMNAALTVQVGTEEQKHLTLDSLNGSGGSLPQPEFHRAQLHDCVPADPDTQRLRWTCSLEPSHGQ
jgi:transposase-like protein